MTKTHAEFLEELKSFIEFRSRLPAGMDLKTICAEFVFKIEQFEAEQKVEES